MLIFNKLYLPSSFTSMACSSLSNVASSSLFRHNAHFATRYKIHQVKDSYHEVKSSRSHRKVMKNSRNKRKIIHYSLISILIFSIFSNIDSYQKVIILSLSLHHSKVLIFNIKSFLKST